MSAAAVLATYRSPTSPLSREAHGDAQFHWPRADDVTGHQTDDVTVYVSGGVGEDATRYLSDQLERLSVEHTQTSSSGRLDHTPPHLCHTPAHSLEPTPSHSPGRSNNSQPTVSDSAPVLCSSAPLSSLTLVRAGQASSQTQAPLLPHVRAPPSQVPPPCPPDNAILQGRGPIGGLPTAYGHQALDSYAQQQHGYQLQQHPYQQQQYQPPRRACSSGSKRSADTRLVSLEQAGLYHQPTKFLCPTEEPQDYPNQGPGGQEGYFVPPTPSSHPQALASSRLLTGGSVLVNSPPSDVITHDVITHDVITDDVIECRDVMTRPHEQAQAYGVGGTYFPPPGCAPPGDPSQPGAPTGSWMTALQSDSLDLLDNDDLEYIEREFDCCRKESIEVLDTAQSRQLITQPDQWDPQYTDTQADPLWVNQQSGLQWIGPWVEQSTFDPSTTFTELNFPAQLMLTIPAQQQASARILPLCGVTSLNDVTGSGQLDAQHSPDSGYGRCSERTTSPNSSKMSPPVLASGMPSGGSGLLLVTGGGVTLSNMEGGAQGAGGVYGNVTQDGYDLDGDTGDGEYQTYLEIGVQRASGDSCTTQKPLLVVPPLPRHDVGPVPGYGQAYSIQPARSSEAGYTQNGCGPAVYVGVAPLASGARSGNKSKPRQILPKLPAEEGPRDERTGLVAQGNAGMSLEELFRISVPPTGSTACRTALSAYSTSRPSSTEERRELSTALDNRRVASLSTAALLSPDSDGDLYLHIVIAHKEVGLVEAYLCRCDREGVTSRVVDYANTMSQTPLLLGVASNQPEVVRMLVERGADVNKQCTLHGPAGPVHYRALHKGATRGLAWVPTLCQLLRAPALQLNAFNSEGRTALHRAIEVHGDLQPFDQSDEDLIALETGGGGARQGAIQNGRRGFAPIDSRLVILQLLMHGADVTLPDLSSGKTPAHFVVEKKSSEFLSWFLKVVSAFTSPAALITPPTHSIRSLVNARTNQNVSVLQLAAAGHMTAERVAVIRQLVESGAEVSRTGDQELKKRLSKIPPIAALLKLTSPAASTPRRASARSQRSSGEGQRSSGDPVAQGVGGQ